LAVEKKINGGGSASHGENKTTEKSERKRLRHRTTTRPFRSGEKERGEGGIQWVCLSRGATVRPAGVQGEADTVWRGGAAEVKTGRSTHVCLQTNKKQKKTIQRRLKAANSEAGNYQGRRPVCKKTGSNGVTNGNALTKGPPKSALSLPHLTEKKK